jgi:hypothetical protein
MILPPQKVDVVPIQSISLSSILKKPHYLQDYHPFLYVFSRRNITLQVVKAGAVTLSLGLLDYNIYLENTMRVLSKQDDNDNDDDEIEMEDYDWDKALVNGVIRFRDNVSRFFSTSVIRKIYESIAYSYCPIKLLDRLTKDVEKSLERKIHKYYHYFDISSKMYVTSFYSNILFFTASATYDGIVKSIEAIQTKQKVQVSQIMVWLGKKCITVALNLSFSALGYAVGSYVGLSFGQYVKVSYCCNVGAVAFELAGGLILNALALN